MDELKERVEELEQKVSILGTSLVKILERGHKEDQEGRDLYKQQCEQVSAERAEMKVYRRSTYLSKRGQVAAMVLSGLVGDSYESDISTLAADSVTLADALLKALEG